MTTADRHLCTGKLPENGYGPAIDRCREDAEGRFWIDNGEYFSQVAFCPYCGTKAPVQLSEDPR